jgi:para-nitrobenzyl esterase
MTEASTTSGRIRGSAIAQGVVFRGIPFAAPPVGENRFRPPQAVAPWDGVRDATAFGAICPQLQLGESGGVLAALGSGEPMDEDCLFLNVWTPAVDDGARPVMVFIHGGAFRGGSGSTSIYDGAAFARDGVVLVTINYRLHALGFLALDGLFDGAEGTGNLGILDQVAALRWVQDNIAAFGGDPANVTIFGESAGAMSVGTLLGTPSAQGLFQRAILESGAARHNISAPTARRIAERTLELLEVPPGDWDALRAVPVDRIVAVANQIGLFEGRGLLGEEAGIGMAYVPVVDGITRDELPIDLVRNGSARGIDLLVGTCAEEWRLFIWGLGPEMAKNLPPPDISPYFASSGRATEEVLKVYAEARPDGEELDLLADAQADYMFGVPAVRLAEAQVPVDPDVWMYRFSWQTPVMDGRLGACHALELPFVFETLDSARDFVSDSAPADLAASVHAAWVRFASTGDPNGGDLPQWPRYDPDTRAVMDFGATRTLLHDPGGLQRQLWDGVW